VLVKEFVEPFEEDEVVEECKKAADLRAHKSHTLLVPSDPSN